MFLEEKGVEVIVKRAKYTTRRKAKARRKNNG